MPNLLSVPVELLLLIFENLSDLDDPVCLAKTCTAMRNVYNCHKRKLLWCIIRNSNQHKYDSALCRLHDTMHGTENDTILKCPAEPLLPPAWIFGNFSESPFDEQPQANSKDNRDRHLKNILTWWQQTSWLRNIYMNNVDLYLSVVSFVDAESLTTPQIRQQYDLALYFDRMFAVTGKICPPSCSNQKRAPSKRRFYRAVMGLFLDTKALQFAKFCRVHEKSDQLTENVRYMWSRNPQRTLEESFEMLEAFDFISNFMLLHILNTPDTLLKWMSILQDAGLGEAAEQFVEDPDETILHIWTSLLTRLQPYLTPFDILSLFTKDELDHDILRYFAALLAFVDHEGEPPGMNDRENDVSRKLERDFDVASDAWKLYRHHGWRCGIRGEIFHEHHNFEKIASHIVQFQHDGHHWWESMIEVETDLLARDFLASIPHIYLMDLSTAAENIDDDRKISFTIPEEHLTDINEQRHCD